MFGFHSLLLNFKVCSTIDQLYTFLEHSFYLFLTSEKLFFVVYSERILVTTRFLLSSIKPRTISRSPNSRCRVRGSVWGPWHSGCQNVNVASRTTPAGCVYMFKLSQHVNWGEFSTLLYSWFSKRVTSVPYGFG